MDTRSIKLRLALINVKAYLNLNRHGFPESIWAINEIAGREDATEEELRAAATKVLSSTAHIAGRPLDELGALMRFAVCSRCDPENRCKVVGRCLAAESLEAEHG